MMDVCQSGNSHRSRHPCASVAVFSQFISTGCRLICSCRKTSDRLSAARVRSPLTSVFDFSLPVAIAATSWCTLHPRIWGYFLVAIAVAVRVFVWSVVIPVVVMRWLQTHWRSGVFISSGAVWCYRVLSATLRTLSGTTLASPLVPWNRANDILLRPRTTCLRAQHFSSL